MLNINDELCVENTEEVLKFLGAKDFSEVRADAYNKIGEWRKRIFHAKVELKKYPSYYCLRIGDRFCTYSILHKDEENNFRISKIYRTGFVCFEYIEEKENIKCELTLYKG